MGTHSEVLIGIISYGGPHLRRTLDAVRNNTHYPHRLVVIADGVDYDTERFLGSQQYLSVLKHPYPLGPAACANRLLKEATERYLVLVQEGCHPAPGWLPPLIGVLKAQTDHGIAGPSTSLAWNEQQVVAQPDWDDFQISRYALRLRDRFGTRLSYLDELHNPADFCFAVKREVAANIGPFDEGYGLGPCYEIDFATRAARAGYKTVWVKASYVHRLTWFPHDPYFRQRFTAAKERYQAKFCGLKLGLPGQCARNFEHCLGEACHVFAPPALISTREEKRADGDRPTTDRPPMVSCIMPTRDRRPFVGQAIGYFLRQDYERRELIIVDDGKDSIHDLIPPDSRIRYIRLDRRTTTGEKRNTAVSFAAGAFIAHWDDDDWHGKNRLSHQIAPLLEQHADMTGMDTGVIYDLESDEFWGLTPEFHARLFVQDVPGGTLVYRKKVWDEGARFPALDLAEDADFLVDASERGARILKVPNSAVFIYIRHGRNTWQFQAGNHLEPDSWRKLEKPSYLPNEDWRFYESLRRSLLAGRPEAAL